MNINTHSLDFISFIWFLCCWLGYSFYAFSQRNSEGNLYNITSEHRLKWMIALNKRDDRIVDVATVGNIMRSITFFASTSILIVAAIMPLLGYAEKATKAITIIPFVESSSPMVWAMKAMLLIVIFIYAFFKYTWALRQYNYASILIVSTPLFKKDNAESRKLAQRNAKVLSNAARHFSLGVRSFYFGLAVLSWFLSAKLFIIVTAFVVLVIYRREFMSRALNFLSE